MNLPPFASPLTALKFYESAPDVMYSIELAARLSQVPRRLIALYYRHRLVAPVRDPATGGWYFNDEGILTLRRIEHLRTVCGMNLTAIRMVLDLSHEVAGLRAELRRWRGY